MIDYSRSSRTYNLLPKIATAMASDGNGLFAASLSGKSKSDRLSQSSDEPDAKRRLLRRWDHIAVQALNPFGVSDIEKATLTQIWEIVAQGHKKANYLAEWPDEDDYRRGVAISRLAQVLLAAIEILDDEKMTKLLDKVILLKARREAIDLLPHLRMLNGGKASQEPRKTTLGSLGTAKEIPKKEEEVSNSAKELHTWLQQPTSTLRALLSFLSQGGVFYSASVAEKTARSYVHCKQASPEDFSRIATARLCKIKSEDTAPPDDQACLFEDLDE
jgi:hypothetical protein